MNLSLQEHGSHNLFIECVNKDGVYGFPFSQLVKYLVESNPDLARTPDAPPERISLWFSTDDVVVTGWFLEPIRELLREGKSFTLVARDTRYLNLKPKECFVAEISVVAAGES